MQYMLMTNQEQIASEWCKYKNYTVRPLASTVSYYKKVLDAHSIKKHCLMYGGTPEIRDLFQESNLNVILSSPMIKSN